MKPAFIMHHNGIHNALLYMRNALHTTVLYHLNITHTLYVGNVQSQYHINNPNNRNNAYLLIRFGKAFSFDSFSE